MFGIGYERIAKKSSFNSYTGYVRRRKIKKALEFISGQVLFVENLSNDEKRS